MPCTKDLLRRCFARALAVACVCLAFAPQCAWACPGCKDSLTENYVSAYAASIVFMLSMPFLILAGLSGYFYWEVRKARAVQAKLAAGDTPESASPRMSEFALAAQRSLKPKGGLQPKTS